MRWIATVDGEGTDNINQFSAAEVVDGCYQDGNLDLCALITRTGGISPTNPDVERISLVGVPYINQESVKAVGVDFEAGYTRRVNWFGGGEIAGLRLPGTYLSVRSATDSEGNKTEFQGAFNLPEWVFILSGYYRRGPLGLSMQAKYTDDMIINRNWNHNGASTQWDVLDNKLESKILVDARVSYDFQMADGKLGLYLHINNLFDKWPQRYLAGAFNSWFANTSGLGAVSDLRGRRYVAGVSYEFE